MKRDLTALTKMVYDVVVVGGGIYGACVARDATLRGLSVALVEKGDFGSATSANSLKIVHGGFRYLQHGDFKRMRESARERRTLMRIAPHLVHPLPVVVPTYGHGLRSREMFSLALVVNDLITWDRNRLDDPQKHIPRGRVLSRGECVELLPGIRQDGLTGAATFCDAQVYNSERLVLSILRSAQKAGADLANYAEVTGFLGSRDSVAGVKAKDVLEGGRFEIRGRAVINASGPWVDRVLGLVNGRPTLLGMRFARAINLITHQLFRTHAVGIFGQNGFHDADAIVNKGSRLLFLTPWRGRSLIGTWYIVSPEGVDECKVTDEDIQDLMNGVNDACPSLDLQREKVAFVHAGLVPVTRMNTRTGYVDLAKQYSIHDHRRHGIRGLVSVVGVKYTTARCVAEKVVNRVFEMWGQRPEQSLTAVTPVYGGQIECFDNFLRGALADLSSGLQEEVVRRLVYNYGSAYPQILRYVERASDGELAATDNRAVLRAEVRYAVREEMAQKLTDVVLRRTELGTAGHPGPELLKVCADVMREELGWSVERAQQELQEVDQAYRWR